MGHYCPPCSRCPPSKESVRTSRGRWEPVGAGVPHHDLAFPIWRGSRRASLLI
ncbi:hypothetical protein ACFFX0_29750 [Citricoccus parietis]|uniref:Uncharacterized protein n=1 Tax=Citricoccus parietis TaxID=592307 RepID=A0ABV5G853_9MICC